MTNKTVPSINIISWRDCFSALTDVYRINRAKPAVGLPLQKFHNPVSVKNAAMWRPDSLANMSKCLGVQCIYGGSMKKEV